MNNYKKPIPTIREAIDIATNELNRYNEGGKRNTQYDKDKDGSIFSITNKRHKVEYKDGKMSYFEAYDKDGNITETVSSIWNEDGSIDYYSDIENNTKINSHMHFKYDENGNETEAFSDLNNDGNYEIKLYTKYENGKKVSELSVNDDNEDSIQDWDITTIYFEDGCSPKEEIINNYNNNYTETNQFDENKKLVSYTHDNHYNDNFLNKLLYPFKAKDKDYSAYREYFDNGKFYDRIDYNSDGTIDKLYDPYNIS